MEIYGRDPDWEFRDESSEEGELHFKVAPLTKTEVCLGPQGGNQRNMTRAILWDPLQLGNLQEKYGQKPG